VLLEKMWTKITVQPLSRDELREVITAIYPQLSTVTDRLLDIYFLLSAGKHEVGEDDVQTSTAGKFLSNEGRLISTRYDELQTSPKPGLNEQGADQCMLYLW
jgi:midasin